jgi:hypothetical protein
MKPEEMRFVNRTTDDSTKQILGKGLHDGVTHTTGRNG